MNKQNSAFGKKVIAFTTSFAFIATALGVSVAIAAITFSNTSITGDSSFTGITGVASSTFDFGAGTLSLQTASNSPITAGTGLFTMGGAFTQSGGVVKLASTTITGNATTTNLSITAFGSGCLTVSASGAVATTTCGGSGTVTTSTALTANNFPFWGTTAGALSGTSTLSISGTTLTQSNNFLLGGTLNVTSTATFAAGLTQSGGLVSLASTTIAGNATTTNLSVTAFSSGCLSVSAGGVVATSTCSGGGTVTTSTAITANNFPFWGTTAGALSGTSTLSISGTTLTQTNNFLLGGTLNVTSTAAFAAGLTQSGGLVSLASTTITGNATTTGALAVQGATTLTAALTQSGGTASLASTTVNGSLTINSGPAITKFLNATSSIGFGTVATSTCATNTVTVTGAGVSTSTTRDTVTAGPGSTVESGLVFAAFVSSANTVTVRACNVTTANISSASSTWSVDVWQH